MSDAPRLTLADRAFADVFLWLALNPYGDADWEAVMLRELAALLPKANALHPAMAPLVGPARSLLSREGAVLARQRLGEARVQAAAFLKLRAAQAIDAIKERGA